MEKQKVIEMKEKCLNIVQELNNEINQNKILIKSCDEAVAALIDEKVTKKIKYNSIIAQNASMNPDVAGPDDKEKAEKNIEESTIQLTDSIHNLKKVEEDIKAIDNANIIKDRDALNEFIQENVEICENWLEYSQKVLKGEYDVIDAKKEETHIEEAVEEVNQEEDLGDKVVAVEPYVEKEEVVDDVENDILLMDDLDKELDEAINSVHDNIVDIKNDLDTIDSPEEELPVPDEEPIVTDLEDTLTSINLLDEETKLDEIEEEPLVIDNGIVEGTNIDEGPVKVVKVEEIGAPEEVQEEEKGQSRKLAA